MGFEIEVPKKRARNAYALAGAKGEVQKSRKMESKKHKKNSNRSDWKKEDWD